jgi:hypothetical protein
MSRRLGGKLRATWARLRRRGPPWDDALVPAGLPKTPLMSGAVALPLPEPEVRDVDAYGRRLEDGDFESENEE